MSELKRYDQLGPICIIETPDGRWVDPDEAEAALKEKDARIKELEALVEKLKCCGNCVYYYDGKSCPLFCVRDFTSNVDRWEARG